MASASLLVSLSAIGQSINFSRKRFPSSGMDTVVALASGSVTTYSYTFVLAAAAEEVPWLCAALSGLGWGPDVDACAGAGVAARAGVGARAKVKSWKFRCTIIP